MDCDNIFEQKKSHYCGFLLKVKKERSICGWFQILLTITQEDKVIYKDFIHDDITMDESIAMLKQYVNNINNRKE